MVQYLFENGPEVISDSRKLKFSWRSMQPPHTHLVGHFTHKLGLWPPLAHLFCSTSANFLNAALKIFEISVSNTKGFLRRASSTTFSHSAGTYTLAPPLYFSICAKSQSLGKYVCLLTWFQKQTVLFWPKQL